MSESLLYTALLLVGIIAAALGYTLSMLRSRSQIDQIREKYATLNERFAHQRNETSEKLSSVERVHHDLEQTLASFASPDLSISNKEKFAQVMLQPLQETLKSADLQAKQIHREREKTQRLIQKQLAILQTPEQLARGNPKAVATLLNDNEARQQWGLTTLKDLLESTYLTDRYHLCGETSEEREHLHTCLINLVDGKQIAIDVDAPFETYINICQAPDTSVRSWHMESHARKLRERIMTISGHAYRSRFEQPPEQLILLILNDHYLSTAMEVDNDLAQFAAHQGVLLATPSDLLTLLLAISFSWQQEQFAKEASKLRETGVHLYRHFGTFIKLIAELGSELSGVVDSYHRAVSYFELETHKAAAAEEGKRSVATPATEQGGTPYPPQADKKAPDPFATL